MVGNEHSDGAFRASNGGVAREENVILRGAEDGILRGAGGVISTGGGGIAMKGKGLGTSRKSSNIELGALWGVSSKIENLSNGLGQRLRKGAMRVRYSSAV